MMRTTSARRKAQGARFFFLFALTFALCPAVLAQEVAGRGWTVSDSEQRSREAQPVPIVVPEAIVYPKEAIRKGWEGRTVVAVEVFPDGSVGRTALARSSGHTALDQTAQDAIKTWKFSPAQDDDETVPQYVDIPVTFKLKN